jgi:hypothetical protein
LSAKTKTRRKLPRLSESNSGDQFALVEFQPDVFVFVKFVAQSSDAHIKQPGGVRAVIFAMFQRGENVMFFNF